jgi:hypothetical protein
MREVASNFGRHRSQRGLRLCDGNAWLQPADGSRQPSRRARRLWKRIGDESTDEPHFQGSGDRRPRMPEIRRQHPDNRVDVVVQSDAAADYVWISPNLLADEPSDFGLRAKHRKIVRARAQILEPLRFSAPVRFTLDGNATLTSSKIPARFCISSNSGSENEMLCSPTPGASK